MYSTHSRSHTVVKMLLVLNAAVCDAIFPIDNGDVEITGSLPGDEAIYTCDDGFRLVGNSILVCQGGSFVGPPPTCVPGIYTFLHYGSSFCSSAFHVY